MFNQSFTRGQARVTDSQGNAARPKIIAGGNLDDVVNHYVRTSTQVQSSGQKSVNGNPIPMTGAIDANMQKTIGDRRDIKNILAMNPNAQLAIDIVVNGTLSPNNTLDSSLQYKSSYDKLGALKPKLLQKIQDVMNEYIDLEDKLPLILRDAKYDVGSYAMLVIPMSNVKDFIAKEKIEERQKQNDRTAFNPAKMESFYSSISNNSTAINASKNKSYLSNFNSRYVKPQLIDIKLEEIGFKSDEFIDKKVPGAGNILIHSDLSVVRLGHIRAERLKMESMDDCLDAMDGFSSYDPNLEKKQFEEGIVDGLKTEGLITEEAARKFKMEGLSDTIIDDALDRARGYSLDDVLRLSPSTDVESNDLPIFKHIPHESIFIAHKPGSPEQHEGYFISMDMTGNPVSIEAELDMYMPTYSGIYGNEATNSAMAGQTNFAAGNLELGYSGSMLNRTIPEKTALFAKLMNQKIQDLISNGYFKDHDITISKKNELMDIMFSRLCANKQTQLVYVPASLLTYVAFDYDDNGNGQSLVIKHRNIGVLNSILTLANTISAVNNTIDYKKIRVGWDDDEVDFNKTIEQVGSNLARYTTLNASRLMNTDVNSQIDYLGHHGYQWEFDQHPHAPSTSVSIEHLDRERTQIDPETVEKNESLLIQSLGSTPEVVDMARTVEFASSYFQSNLQAARQAIADQKVLTGFTDKFIQCYVLNAPAVLKWMIQSIDKLRPELPEIRGMKTIDVVREFVKSIRTQLPKPDMVKVELLDKAIQAQEQLIDHILKYTIGEEALEGADVGDDLEATLEAYRRKLKALIMREWMANNNMFNEGLINGLYTGDQEEVDAVFERIETQQAFIINALKKHKVITDKVIQKASAEITAIQNAQGTDGVSGGGGSDFGSDNNDNQDNNQDNQDSQSNDDNFGLDNNQDGQATEPGAEKNSNDPFA